MAMREVSCFNAGKREAVSMARNRRWNHELKLFVATLLHSTCKKVVVVVGEIEILYFKVRYTKEGRGGVADAEVKSFLHLLIYLATLNWVQFVCFGCMYCDILCSTGFFLSQELGERSPCWSPSGGEVLHLIGF